MLLCYSRLAYTSKIVQERLGHSSISMTMDIYSHVFPSYAESGVRPNQRDSEHQKIGKIASVLAGTLEKE